MQSFANNACSGKESCQIRVHDLIPYFKPCPVELSSFMEASFKCLAGKTIIFTGINAKLCFIRGYFLKYCLQISSVMQMPYVPEKVTAKYQLEI